MIHMTMSQDCFFSFVCIVAIVYLSRLLFRAITEEWLKSFVQRAPSHLGLFYWFPCINYIFDSFKVTLVQAFIGPLFKRWIKDRFFLKFQSSLLFIIMDLFIYFLDWMHGYFFSYKWLCCHKWIRKRNSSLFIDLIVLIPICIFLKYIWVLIIVIRVIFVRVLSSIRCYTCLLSLFNNGLFRRSIILVWSLIYSLRSQIIIQEILFFVGKWTKQPFFVFFLVYRGHWPH